MGTLTYTVPVAGTDLNSVADPEIATALTTILTWADGNIDAVNLSALLAQAAGVNQSGQVVKGSTNIATSQSTTSTSYTTLSTPDEVTGIVLPSRGLLAVWYHATVTNTVGSAGSAAIFVGSNQAKQDAATPTVQAATGLSGTGAGTVVTSDGGLNNGNYNGYTGDVTTGQIVSPCYLFAAAGTYTVSIQFKASSGTVTAANRQLWVEAISFS